MTRSQHLKYLNKRMDDLIYRLNNTNDISELESIRDEARKIIDETDHPKKPVTDFPFLPALLIVLLFLVLFIGFIFDIFLWSKSKPNFTDFHLPSGSDSIHVLNENWCEFSWSGHKFLRNRFRSSSSSEYSYQTIDLCHDPR